MLSGLTRLRIDHKLESIPTIEEMRKQNEDLERIPLKDYLHRYYSILSPYEADVWSKIMLNLVEPSYDETQYSRMAFVFGYSSILNHDFGAQNEMYEILKEDYRLDDDIRKFLGFMAGTHFFEEYEITISEWFSTPNWSRPELIEDHCIESISQYSINDYLKYLYGLNYLKVNLPLLNYWKR